MNHLARRALISAIALGVLAVRAVEAADRAAPAANESRLARWVDDDVGVCVQFDGLPRQWAAFSEGALSKRLLAFPPAAFWWEGHRTQLAALGSEVERRTGAAPHDVCSRLLGGEVLFAVWPPAKAEPPRAVLLAEAADRELMLRTLQKLVAARRQAGKWRGERTLVVAKKEYAVNAVVSDDEQAEFFLASAGDVALIATSEALLRTVLGHRPDAGSKASLASSPAYVASRKRLVSGATASLFINPRAWDGALEADLKNKTAGSEEACAQAAVVATWAATDYVAASLRLMPDLNGDIVWKWRADDLPPGVREVAASLKGPSALVDHLPSDALAAFAGHADLGRLVRLVVAEQWQKKALAAAGSAAANDNNQPETLLAWALAPGLGPGWAAYLTAASGRTGPLSLPIDLVVGMQTRALELGADQPALVRNIEPLLHAWLSAAVEAANRQSGEGRAMIESTVSEPPAGEVRKITVVRGIVPDWPRQEVAYCVDDQDRFWAATSAASLSAPAAPPAIRLWDREAIRAGLDLARAPSGLAYVNLAAWREMAANARESVDFLWQGQPLDERAKEQRYRDLLALAQLADRLLLTSYVDESTVGLSLVISADELP